MKKKKTGHAAASAHVFLCAANEGKVLTPVLLQVRLRGGDPVCCHLALSVRGQTCLFYSEVLF